MPVVNQPKYAVGSLIRTRGREWVVVPSDEDEVLSLRPLSGSERGTIGLGAIRSADTPPVRDFYRQCLALEGLMDEFEPYRQKNLAFFNSLLRETANEPNLVQPVELLGRGHREGLKGHSCVPDGSREGQGAYTPAP